MFNNIILFFIDLFHKTSNKINFRFTVQLITVVVGLIPTQPIRFRFDMDTQIPFKVEQFNRKQHTRSMKVMTVLECLCCEIDKVEGRRNREGNLMKVTEQRRLRHVHGSNYNYSKTSSSKTYRERGQRWDRFSKQQKRNILLPRITGIVKGLYDSSMQQQRNDVKGNVDHGSHVP